MTIRRRGLDEEQVVAAAAALADEHGLEAVTLSRLARELGVRPPSLYNHVASLDALVGLMAIRAGNLLADALAGAAAGRSGADALLASATAYRAFAHEHPGLYPTTVRAPQTDEVALVQAAERVLDLMGATLRHWQLEGDDLTDALRAIRSAIHGFVVLEAGNGFAMDRDPTASFNAMIVDLASGFDRRLLSGV